MPAKIDMTGLVFGRLTVKGESTVRKDGRRKVDCDCVCGTSITCDPRSLRMGHTRSCGCLQRQKVSETARSRTKHGDVRSKEYVAWIHMRMRCSNPKNTKYKDYGARGIRVCERWDGSYDDFLSDMGRAPSRRHSVDRIDVNGDYSLENCRWATPIQQSRNKRSNRLVDFDGQMVPLSQACEKAGVNYRSALNRINVGKHWMPLNELGE